jgi:CDP-diacylglycerol--glycerol-3-phosphate 3-phosphatidyltransferase
MLSTRQKTDYSDRAENKPPMSIPQPQPALVVEPTSIKLRDNIRSQIWNLPNSLTLFRIFLVPFLVVALLTKYSGREYAGLAIFLVAAITDFFDGYFARKYNQTTRLGTLLDPIADKLLMSAAFVSLVELQYVKAWMVVVILGREFAVRRENERAALLIRQIDVAVADQGRR